MPFDAHANLAVSVVAVAPSPPDSGTSLTVTAGHGVRFPAPPFNVTIWAASSLPNPTTAEVARCTALVGDVLTLVRAAEPPAPARTVVIGDLVAETITAKALQDIESGTNFPLISTPGPITSGGTVTGAIGQFGNLGTTPIPSMPPQAHHLTHETGGADAVVSLSAAVLTSGTLPDARLSANVQLKPIAAVDLPLHATRHQPGGSDPLAVDAGAATGSLRTLGTGANQAASGTDARFTNARTPTAHAPSHGSGQSDPVTVTALAGYPGGTVNFLRADGTFATPTAGVPAAHHLTHETGGTDQVVNLSAAVLTSGTLPDARLSATVQLKPIAAADLPAHATRHQPGGADAMAVDAAAATGSLRTLGTGATQAAAGNDTRLTNARTPTAHATTHSSGQSDPVTVTALAGYPGGTTNFLRADGTFATPTTGVPGAHHLTHEVGGSDQITGAMAITTLAVGTNPSTSGVLRLANGGAITSRNAANTADLPLATTGGDAVVFGSTAIGGVYIVAGHTLLLRSDAYGVLDLAGGNLYGLDVNQFYPFGSKTLGLPAYRWTTGYFNAIDASGTLTERGRITPLGEWTNVPNNAADFSVAGGGGGTVTVAGHFNRAYSLVGKTCTYTFSLQLTITGTPLIITIVLPSGVVAATASDAAFIAGTAAGRVSMGIGLSSFNLYRDATGATTWTAGTLFYFGTFSFQIQ